MCFAVECATAQNVSLESECASLYTINSLAHRSATLKLVLVFLLVAAVEASGSYDNFAGGELLVECPPGHGMDYFLSRFSPVLSLPGNPGDRVWDWECTKVAIMHT